MLRHGGAGFLYSLLWSLCLSTGGTDASQAQPLTFQNLLVDAGASGDDKIVVDIDLDGYADGVLGGNPTGTDAPPNELAWWRSLGPSRTFSAKHHLRQALDEFTTDMDAADVDGDGDFDLIFADGWAGQNVWWFENPVIDPPNGNPDPANGANWAEHVIGSHGNYAHDIEVGFLDGVAGLDVVTLGFGFFKIHFQDAGGWTTVDFGQFATDGSPAIADIDRDGDRDIFVKGGWIESPPSGRRVASNWTFHPITSSDPGDGPAAAAADIDRDGRIDLVTCRQHDESGALAWFRNPANPTQASWPRTEIDDAAGSHHLRVADFDGDARPDLLVGLELAAGYITVFRNTGSTPAFTAHPVAAGGGGHNAAVGDLDGNGLPDVWAADWIGHPPLRAYFNAPDLMFRDGFESGNTSRWSAAAP